MIKKFIEKIYAFPLWLRWYLYRQKIFKTEYLSKPVISIGGLKFGGVGKTPLVEHIAKILVSNGLRVSVLTRGYGRKSKERIVIENGDGNWRDCGDEPLMLSKRLPDVKIVVHPNRFESGKSVESETDVFLLDDGFQHIRLGRNLDIIAFAGDEFEDNLFPFGSRRDGLWRMENLEDAAVVVPSQNYDKISDKIGDIPVFRSDLSIEGFCKIDDFRNVIPAEKLHCKNVFLTAGIASPHRFERTVKTTGARIVGVKWFRDHKFFESHQVENVIAQAKKKNAEIILTTAKDAVRLPENARENFYSLLIRYEIEPSHKFERLILNAILNR